MIAKATKQTELGPSHACRRLDMRESFCGDLAVASRTYSKWSIGVG